MNGHVISSYKCDIGFSQWFSRYFSDEVTFVLKLVRNLLLEFQYEIESDKRPLLSLLSSPSVLFYSTHYQGMLPEVACRPFLFWQESSTVTTLEPIVVETRWTLGDDS